MNDKGLSLRKKDCNMFFEAKRMIRISVLVACWLALAGPTAAQVRIKDITSVEGFRSNQLTGIGLVTGLNGTGGKGPVTRRALQNMLQSFDLRADPNQRLSVGTDTQLRTDNVAVVMVKANLPIFAKPGSQIDVTVSAIDDSKSLQGGVLMVTVTVALSSGQGAVPTTV